MPDCKLRIYYTYTYFICFGAGYSNKARYQMTDNGNRARIELSGNLARIRGAGLEPKTVLTQYAVNTVKPNERQKIYSSSPLNQVIYTDLMRRAHFGPGGEFQPKGETF